jgi:sugar/nucleoside kinase (ribokinase family)
MQAMASERSGVLAAGNFIVDQVKLIDAYPEQDMLASILSESRGNGGGPYNVLKDLAAMGAPFPLEAAGLVGCDADGDWILQDCAAAGIGTAALRQTTDAPTSYTDAMTVASTGRRTFFHQRGANALLGERHFDLQGLTGKIFHLGYLLLLDEMDRLLEDGRTVASRVLESASAAGFHTSVDVVSASHPDFARIVRAALPFTDTLILNEIEAGNALGKNFRGADGDGLEAAARELLEAGVRERVVIHCAEGGVCVARGESVRMASLRLPPDFIAGATGAGDAFAAGFLFGLHEDWPAIECLRLAVSAAAACLSDPSASGGLRSVEECLDLARRFAGGQGEW